MTESLWHPGKFWTASETFAAYILDVTKDVRDIEVTRLLELGTRARAQDVLASIAESPLPQEYNATMPTFWQSFRGRPPVRLLRVSHRQ
jgi:hypothetical protein